MKSVRILGRGIPVLAIVIAVLASVGVASAALLTHYGTAETTADIRQSVKLNGNAWDVPTVIGPVDVVAGNTWPTEEEFEEEWWQQLTNDASVPVDVQLSSEITSPDDSTGVNIMYLVWEDGEEEPVVYENPAYITVPPADEGGLEGVWFAILLTTDPRVVPEPYIITTTILTVELV